MALFVTFKSPFYIQFTNKLSIAIALDNPCKYKEHNYNCCCKNLRYHKITQGFVSNVYNMKVPPNMLLLFEKTKEAGLARGEMAFMVNDEVDNHGDQNINENLSRSPSKPGESALQLCGTHL